MNLGQSIKDIRIQRGLNQKQLAELADTTQTAISQIEKGNRSPSDIMVGNLAIALEVSVAYIYVQAIGVDDIQSTDQDYPNAEFMLQTGKALILRAL